MVAKRIIAKERKQMKYINCPMCGSRLFEGEDGSHIVLKCGKCGRLFEASVEEGSVFVALRSKQKESETKRE